MSTAAARRRLAAYRADLANSRANDPAWLARRDTELAAIKAAAEEKMAIVDALRPENRAKVHTYSLRAFANHRTTKAAYQRAKARVGITHHTHPTQTAEAAARLAGSR